MNIRMRAPTGPDVPHVLLVNPWIHDFAAYDFWAKPYGLLLLAALLRQRGLKVTYLDCLDRFHPLAPPSDPHARGGRGPYLKTALPRPAGLADVKRTYSRYGIPPEWLRQDLSRLRPPPDLILVTSMMTYWYPGVFETIRSLKAHFPSVPLVLGGVYARLCTEHARAASGADEVATDNGESLFAMVERLTGYDPGTAVDLDRPDDLPYPAFDLQRAMSCVALLTLRGCPFACAYCASRYLQPKVIKRSARSMVEEIVFWHKKHGVVDFAFYDDALLADAREHAVPMLEAIAAARLPVSFHTPNALHIRGMTAQTARLLFESGFKTIRLGLETISSEGRAALDRKVDEADFAQAVGHLRRAGFRSDQVGAYLLLGLPGQSLESVRDAIEVVKSMGVTPTLAYYTPIPHTRLWPRALASSRYDLAADPVFCNNAFMPCRHEGFSWQQLSALKQMARL